MVFLKVWQKLALFGFLVVIPLGVFGYLAGRTEYRQLRAEERRLAGLQSVQTVRKLVEQFQRHRTAAMALATGDTTFEPQRLVVQDQIEEIIEEMTELQEQWNDPFAVADDWQEVQDRWGSVKARHRFLKPEEIAVAYDRLFAEMQAMAGHMADRSGLIFVLESDRHYLHDNLAFKQLSLVQYLGEVQAVATSASLAKTVSPADRSRLEALRGSIALLRDRLDGNLSGLSEANPELGDQLEAAGKAASMSCNDLFLFLDIGLIRPSRIDVEPAGVHFAVQKPITAALQLFDEQLDAGISLTEAKIAQARQALYGTIGIAAGALLAVVLLVVLIGRGMAKQLYEIIALMGNVEKGDRQARAKVYSRDELGQLAGSFNHMLDHTHTLTQSQEERDRIQAAVARLQEDVHDAAAGDLTRVANVGEDVTGPIAESFNFMVRQLRQLIGQVQISAQQVNASASQIGTMTDHVRQSAGEQAEQVQQVMREIDGLASSIQSVTRATAQAADIAREALTNGQKGNEATMRMTQSLNVLRTEIDMALRAVQQLVSGTAGLADAAKSLEEVAEWNSILALNAGVHAAAAGEHAPRWALIAETAERLAVRSAQAARQVEGLRHLQEQATRAARMLEEANRRVVDGSLVAGQAGQALGEIHRVGHRLSELTRAINAVCHRQARSTEAVAGAMNRLGEATQRTANGTRQAAVSTASLTRLAERLTEGVRAFRLPEADHEEAVESFLRDEELAGASMLLHGSPAVASGMGNGAAIAAGERLEG
jgi:methyl-accepting chemotaxis protein